MSTIADSYTHRIFRNPMTATLTVAATALCFGLVPFFARELQAAGISDPMIALYRYGFSAMALLPFLPRSREKRKQAVTMIGAGILLGVGWTTYLESVKTASVAAAGVVYMSYPIFAILFAWILLGQRPGGRAILSCVLVVAGALSIVSPADLESGAAWGVLAALPAPITFGLGIVVLCGMLDRLSTMERMACGLLGSTLGLLPMAVSSGTFVDGLTPEPTLAPIILGFALLTAFIPQLLYVCASPFIGPARTAMAGSVELPTMIAIGWLAFGEPIGVREVLATALILAAISIVPAMRSGPAAAYEEKYSDSVEPKATSRS